MANTKYSPKFYYKSKLVPTFKWVLVFMSIAILALSICSLCLSGKTEFPKWISYVLLFGLTPFLLVMTLAIRGSFFSRKVYLKRVELSKFEKIVKKQFGDLNGDGKFDEEDIKLAEQRYTQVAFKNINSKKLVRECHFCGCENFVGDKFCPNCGEKIYFRNFKKNYSKYKRIHDGSLCSNEESSFKEPKKDYNLNLNKDENLITCPYCGMKNHEEDVCCIACHALISDFSVFTCGGDN